MFSVVLLLTGSRSLERGGINSLFSSRFKANFLKKDIINHSMQEIRMTSFFQSPTTRGASNLHGNYGLQFHFYEASVSHLNVMRIVNWLPVLHAGHMRWASSEPERCQCELRAELQLQILCGCLPEEGQRPQEVQREPGSPWRGWMSYWQDSGWLEITAKKAENWDKEAGNKKLQSQSKHWGEKERDE